MSVKDIFYLLENKPEILDRLKTLVSEDDDGIHEPSFWDFIKFVLVNEHLEKPVITLTPDGKIYASWTIRDVKISMHFLGCGDIKCVFL